MSLIAWDIFARCPYPFDLVTLMVGRLFKAQCIARVSWADADTRTDVSLIVVTSVRISSTAWLTESAIAPVMSSVTVASIVRSPSDRSTISSSRRRIAAWLRRFCWSANWARSRASRSDARPSISSSTEATIPSSTTSVGRPERMMCREEREWMIR